MSGIYVALNQTSHSAFGLQNRLELMGVSNLGPFERYHSTIVASKDPFPVDQLVFPETGINAIIKEWTIFKSRADDESSDNCLVGLLESKELQDLHAQCIALGAHHQYDGYNPHITVSYRYNQKLNLKTLPVDYLVRFDPIPTIEPLLYF